MKTFVEYCKDYILDNIDDHEGRMVYLCDLGFELTEEPNASGTLTYCRKEALDYISEWIDDAADYFDYEKSKCGTNRNPFENPEAYMVCMVIEGVRAIIDAAIEHLNLDQDEKVELSQELINDIKEFIEDFDKVKLF